MANIKTKLVGKTTKLSQIIKEKNDDHPARFDNYKNGSFYNVDIDLINPDPEQPRKYFNPVSLAELSQSIKQKGVLQPIIIRKDGNNQIYLIAGERRYRAAKMAGLSKIPAIICTGNPAEIALIENLQRENLKPIEEAEALNRLLEEHNYNQEQLASALGKSKSTISEMLSLNKLPEVIKTEVRRAELSKRVLIEVAKQKTEEVMISLFKQIKEDGLKSNQVREITRNNGEKKQPTPASIVSEKVQSLVKHLSKLDLKSIGKNEKANLLTELKRLKDSLDTILIKY